MSNKTKIPDELQKKLTDEANAYATDKVGDIQTIPANKINEWEKAADGWEAGATIYATQLHEAQQEIERLKAIANLWRPLMEEAIRQDSLYGHVPIETINKIKRFLYGE